MKIALTMEEREGLKPWLIFGVLWGIAALNSPVLLAVLPASGLWAWYHRAKRGKPSFGDLMAMSSRVRMWPAGRSCAATNGRR